MPRARVTLPAELGTAFAVADALAAGVPRTRLRGADLDTPFRGTRLVRPRPADQEHPRARLRREAVLRARALATILPGHAFFSHRTAGLILGLPVPIWDAELDVSVMPPHRVLRGRGIRGHEIQTHLGSVVEHAGLRITSPATTWATLGASLTVRELIQVGDAIVHLDRMPGTNEPGAGRPLATIDRLHAAVSAGRRVGIGRLREALPLVRVGAASPPETDCRLLLTDAGLPEPRLDHDVFDAAGRFLGCSEIAYPRHRVAVEYEGDHHRMDPAQWNRDIRKYQDYADAGWSVIRVTKALLRHDPARVVAHVRAALTRNGRTHEFT